MKFDDITILLGEFGKYQKQLYFLLCLPSIFTGMQMLSSVFTLAIPDHRYVYQSESRIYFDNVTLTIHNVTLTSHKPCQH